MAHTLLVYMVPLQQTQRQRRWIMAPEEFKALEAQIEALDKESACRVACGASIPLALQAVADANARRMDAAARRRPTPRQRLAQICSTVAALR